MAKREEQERSMPIRLAFKLYQISQACYRSKAQLNTESEQIANWLIRLTDKT